MEAEWATCKLISAFNTLDDGDACCIGNMANAAFWQHYPLRDRYVQAPPPSAAQLQARNLTTSSGAVIGGRLYYMLYAGDYDSAAWVYSQLRERWEDPARGSVPIGWGVDPGLAARFPPAWPLLLGGGATAMDNIITGDSGAGYLNPTMLSGAARANVSGLPDGRAPWVALNTALNRQFGLRFTGFSISGDAPTPGDADDALYFNFSSAGVVNQGWPSLSPHLVGNLPVITQWDLPQDVGPAAAVVASYTKPAQSAPTWMMFRSVLTSPAFLAAVAANASALTGAAATPVTPLELAALMRVSLGGSNDNFVSYVDDTLPAVAAAGAVLLFNATVRNDGWNVLSAGSHGLVVSVTAVQQIARRVAARGGVSALNRGEAHAEINQVYHPLVALDGGVGITQSTRRILARAGFGGAAPKHAAPPAAAAVFPLPADLTVGGSVVVPASVQLPALSRGAGAGALVDVTYQLARLDAHGGVIETFDALGSIAWLATLLVTP